MPYYSRDGVRMITVGDIRKAIDGLPDSARVVIVVRPKGIDGADGGSNVPLIVDPLKVTAQHGVQLEIDI